MTRLGLAPRVKCLEIDARFPRHAADVPLAAVAYVANQVRVPVEAFTAYDLYALREAICRRETWIVRASRWLNPEQDLPADFQDLPADFDEYRDGHRDGHSEALRQPREPTAFIATLRDQLRQVLSTLEVALASGQTGDLAITRRRGEPGLAVRHLDKLPDLTNLGALADEVERRWGTLGLFDALEEIELRTNLTGVLSTVATRQAIPRADLRRRLLVWFALATNMGIRRTASIGEHGETEAALRHLHRRYIGRDNLRRAISTIVSEIFAVRDRSRWVERMACASDTRSEPVG
ncbi:MAG: Tn3 family transposase [Chloroflexi bacterium]|nr:Tn3 family transposase [Chloroflexota bacterium]